MTPTALATAETSQLVGGLTNGKDTYIFQVRATSNAGQSDFGRIQ